MSTSSSESASISATTSTSASISASTSSSLSTSESVSASTSASTSASETPTDNKADAPNPVAQADGSVTITPGADNVSLVIDFTNESGQPQRVETAKGQDGIWTIAKGSETGATIDPTTGVVTLPADKVKDGSTVTATGRDDADNTATGTAIANGTADKPTASAQPDGSVTITPGADNVSLVIDFTDESGQPQRVETAKGQDGRWTITSGSDTGATIDPATGVVTLPADKVKDGSTVTATGRDDADNTATGTAIANGTADKPTPVTPQPARPSQTAKALPNTGDDSNTNIWLGAGLMVGAAALARRRRNEQD